MKGKYFVRNLLILLLINLSFHNYYCNSLYGRDFLPIGSFMKGFAGVSSEEFEAMDAVESSYFEEGFMAGDLSIPAQAGRKFYEKYKSNFEKLYEDAGELLMQPPPSYSGGTEDLELDAPRVNLRFSRSIIRAFRTVAVYHFSVNEFEKSVKALMLANWFSHSIARGGDNYPLLIDLMVSIATRNICNSEVFWSSLAAGNFSPRWLAQVEAMLIKVESSQLSYAESLEFELMGTLHTLKRQMLEQRQTNPQAALMNSLQILDYEKLVEKATSRIFEIYSLTLNHAAAYRLDPVRLAREGGLLVDRIEDFSVVKMTDMLDPARAMARILISMGMPNYSRAYYSYLAARYREKGTILLTRFLARRNDKSALPQTAAEFQQIAQASMPPDLYAAPRTACRFRLCSQWMTLYSIGANQIDNGGCSKDDMILFKLPVSFLQNP